MEGNYEDATIEHLATERRPYSVRYTFLVNGETMTVGGCPTWTVEEAEHSIRIKGAVGRALAACIAADNNFIADSWREACRGN